MEITIYFDDSGSIIKAVITPIPDELAQKTHLHYGELDSLLPLCKKYNVKAYWLTAKAKITVMEQLEARGIDPWKYVFPATVHGEWKQHHNQAIIFTKQFEDITRLANPYKPIPSKREREKLLLKLLQERQCIASFDKQQILFGE